MKREDMYVGQILVLQQPDDTDWPLMAKDGAKARVVDLHPRSVDPKYVTVVWIDDLADGFLPDGVTPNRQSDGNYEPEHFVPAYPVIPTTLDEIEVFLAQAE